jgi:hypothetical protein
MRTVVEAAQKVERTAAIANRIEPAINRFEEVAKQINANTQSDLMLAAAHAFPFMEACGDMVMAWMLLWRARIAAEALAKGGKDAVFYEGQIKSAEFFTLNLLPVTLGKMASILSASNVVNDIPEDAFGGK